MKFGTCCSQVMALFLDIHTPKYKDKREVIWDMAVAMNQELLALRDAGCKCIQIEEPCFHFMANSFGKDHESTSLHARGLQSRSAGTGRRRTVDPHLLGQSEHAAGAAKTPATRLRWRSTSNEAKGDVWTVEMKDRELQQEIELVRALQARPKKKICHRGRQPPHALRPTGRRTWPARSAGR